MQRHRFLLDERDVPAAWYNLAADLPLGPPLLSPVTRQPIAPEELLPIFPRALVEQEWSRDRWIDIPDEVRAGLGLWRPTPLLRAAGLERELGTPARIYFKEENQSPPGSHKANTAVAQAHYARREGVRRLVTETGAGQWGCSLALACALMGMECQVFMVNLSYRQRPYRATMMRLWGARVVASPSDETQAGRAVRAADADSPGSLGIAISESIETARGDPGTKYAIGSVLNHVVLHQSVVGLETRRQLELAGDRPDVIIGCIGGGSNFAGLAFPFLPDKLRGEPIRFVAAEPKACPTLTRGRYCYDHGDTAGMTPLVKMHTLGHDLVPPRIHAGGLRYHGVAPLVSQTLELGLIEPVALGQLEAFESARLLATTEGIIPAIESSYAIAAAVREARRCRETGTAESIVACLSGHGLCELPSYEAFLANQIEELELDERPVHDALDRLAR